MRHPLGIMQGRLSTPPEGKIQCFPKKTWRREFDLCKEADLQLIEWIVEADEVEKNPILAEPQAVLDASKATGVVLRSLCADYFMDLPLLRCSTDERRKRLSMLERVIELMPKFGIVHLTIPFVDASEIKDDKELKETASILKPYLSWLEKQGADLALETSLDPLGFRKLLDLLASPVAKVNYDIGNSASLGYDPKMEMKAYGADIATVHVKDRVKGGTTVPLTTGSADFAAVFSGLAAHNYAGPFILQSARQKPGEELATIKGYAAMVRGWLDTHFAHGPAPRR
jgi:L-ribulose-5-phosphate 3-epimerase